MSMFAPRSVELVQALQDVNMETLRSPAVGIRVDVSDIQSEVPVHRHQQGQLVLALKGAAICEVADALWMVPPHCAVWVPGMMPHSIRATANARLAYLFVQPGAAALPARCCTLGITALVRELVLEMARLPADYPGDGPEQRKATVLLEELTRMPVTTLHLAVSQEPRVRRIARRLAEHPADRRTLGEWAAWVAMSERSLARLVQAETGLSFGRWRQQIHLIEALRLLASGHRVQQVAGALGYDSVTAFISMFKKSLGKPPARYIAEMGLDAAQPYR
ncbi:AraC family transcriptional regulator [Bordetella holmesii]|uniref:DNA-binding helix-turn-helix protein n=2 Tax=Bordetella holmesii TaxID=35814 RepID=A0A158M2R4_9BORD|nr:helix-turn-helix transcriptional regulator [Bordetella holmesii]AHV91834.1 cupin domain protein [Bordetella holmesii ATCC 51541]AIT28423.1 cupin domain protein [Bordetella holmesii 44057]EWM41217.1 cupin domain protein [Bordetella holmesii 35009]EWM42142.1 cupin domain protein [Bordetella holmesii 41130]EWM45106.1 cupin domain protein [Bordetella holmesii 70147]